MGIGVIFFYISVWYEMDRSGLNLLVLYRVFVSHLRN